MAILQPVKKLLSVASAAAAIENFTPVEALKFLKAASVPDDVARLIVSRQVLNKGHLATLKPLLPLLLTLKGKPYTLQDHFTFEPFFQTHISKEIVLKCGRQVSKSTSFAAQGVVQANCIPEFNTLYVTPLFEQIRRFSNNYVRPLVERSPASRLWTGTHTVNNVLERSFSNYSKMTFSFAFLDPDRTRGIPADKVAFDEIQDMDKDFIPIIKETMGASKYTLSQYAGTPKTLDGALEGLWLRSSQAEWEITCHACHYPNIPALTHDLIDMIGPDYKKCSEASPGIVCARCRRNGTITPIFSRNGRWVHGDPEKRYSFPGYHVPQIILPMHYADPDKWMILLGKQRGLGNTPKNVFYNEVCGESYDMGAKLVTQTDLKRAATLHDNTLQNAMAVAGNYQLKVMAVDWGGGGEKRISYTSMAVLGLRPDGGIDCIFGHRSMTPNDPRAEADMILTVCGRLGCQMIAHDYNGAGALREQFLFDAGFPANRVMPITYVRAAAGPMISPKPATAWHPRAYFQVDKSRSLLLVCDQIRTLRIRFFKYDHLSNDEAGLLHDFLSLKEDIVDSKRGMDVHTVIHDDKSPDDFAQAVNYGCCAIWRLIGKLPDVARVHDLRINESIAQAIHPSNPSWSAMGFGGT